jgi:hypothetical protein
LIVANEDIEPQNFWASSKSHVATTYLCMQFCSYYIGLSNQGKYYEIEVQFAKQDVATWLFDEANIFSSIFSSENKGRLAKQAGYPGRDPWHTRYQSCSFQWKKELIRENAIFPYFLLSKLDTPLNRTE